MLPKTGEAVRFPEYYSRPEMKNKSTRIINSACINGLSGCINAWKSFQYAEKLQPRHPCTSQNGSVGPCYNTLCWKPVFNLCFWQTCQHECFTVECKSKLITIATKSNPTATSEGLSLVMHGHHRVAITW